ncbi:MAG: hypothetical protein U9N56_01470 [Actinomycetota bacterium]|nr:hypothetical protein [Actinomycetota bacterium]
MGKTKRCPSCETLLPASEFNYRDRAHKKLQSYCRECSRVAWRRWYELADNKEHHLEVMRKRRKRRRERNRAIVRELKSVPCADCGGVFPFEAMDFDHLEDKVGLISKLVFSVGEERLRAEIAKCEVVCANCHRIRTAL